MHDGAIVFNTKIDNTNVEKDLKATEKKIRSAQDSIYKNENAKLPLVKQAEKLGAKLDEAKRNLEYIRQEMSTVQTAMEPGSNPADYIAASADYERIKAALDAQEKEIQDLQKEWNKVNSKVDEYDLKIQQSREEIERSTQEAGYLRAKLGKGGNSLDGAFNKAEKSAKKFGKRILSIGMSAFVFNVLSAGLHSAVQYMGKMLQTNKQYTQQLATLKGALLTAFQPIYEFVLPGLNLVLKVLTAIVTVFGRFMAWLTGRDYNQMAKNSQALYNQANAIDAVGAAAEKTAKNLAGFDEINKLEDSGASAGGGGSGNILPNFEPLEITQDLEHILALIGAIGAGLLGWKIAGMFTDSLSIAAGLGAAIGSALYYAYSWADAFANGINWKNLTGLLLSAAGVVAGLAVAFGTSGAAVGFLITGIGLAVLALYEWITTGELSNEACAALVIGIMAIGSAIGLFTGSWIPLLVAALVSAVAVIVANWEDISNYFATTFSNGFFVGIQKLGADIWNWLVGWMSDLINWAMRELSGLLSFFSNFSLVGGETIINPTANASQTTYTLAPDVPMLAKGAVIPPNREFMAVLGDQKNGTNVEAPLETIKQALAEVMAQDHGNDRVEQLLEVLISVVEGIEVGDETIGRAAARYNRRAARAGGY